MYRSLVPKRFYCLPSCFHLGLDAFARLRNIRRVEYRSRVDERFFDGSGVDEAVQLLIARIHQLGAPMTGQKPDFRPYKVNRTRFIVRTARPRSPEGLLPHNAVFRVQDVPVGCRGDWGLVSEVLIGFRPPNLRASALSVCRSGESARVLSSVCYIVLTYVEIASCLLESSCGVSQDMSILRKAGGTYQLGQIAQRRQPT